MVGNGAAAALDAQCSYLQAEITQQDQSLAEKQDSLAMLEEQHARAMQRKETQVRGLQRKLFDATTQLRAQEQAMQVCYARLRQSGLCVRVWASLPCACAEPPARTFTGSAWGQRGPAERGVLCGWHLL